MRPRRRPAVLGCVGLVVAGLLAVVPGSAAVAGSTERPDPRDHHCRTDRDDRDVGDRHDDDHDRRAPAAAVEPTTGPSAGVVSATIGIVTFGSHVRRLRPFRAGHVVALRLDVIAAAGTRDPDLHLDVAGARLLTCATVDLVPGHVAHLTLTVWVPRAAACSMIRVVAAVRVGIRPRAARLVVRKTYTLTVCAWSPHSARGKH